MSARAALVGALVALAAPAASRAQPTPSERPRLVLEAGLGGARHDACAACAARAPAPTGAASAHLAVGVLVRRGLSVYLSEDAGSELNWEGSNDTYQYRTAFVELASPHIPALALRAGGGQAVIEGFGGELYGIGPAVRLGVGARTPSDHAVAAIFAVDAFAGFSGHYHPQGGYYADLRPSFRPVTVQVAFGLRAQIPLR